MRFVVLELHALRKRRDLAGLHVIGNGFPVFERAVLHPDLSGLVGHPTIVSRLRSGTGTTNPST